MIRAVILAAGRSSRMGRPKALLTAGPGGPTFVTRVVTAVLDGGTVDALVVTREDAADVKAEVDRLGPLVRWVENPRADAGQLSSLLVGLNAADRPGVRAILVAPVDVPLISADVVATLVAAFTATRRPIVRAAFQGGHGHPVIFGRAVFAELRRADPAIGAKAVLQVHRDEILNVEVNEPGVLIDVDDPAEYARLFGKVL